MIYNDGKENGAMFTVNDVKCLLSSRSDFDMLTTEHFNHELSVEFALSSTYILY